MNLNYLEGRKFCVVFVKVLEATTGKVQCRCLRGRAAINQGHLDVMNERGAMFTVPSSALNTIAPNDGTALLGDCEYYCLVKVDPNIDLERGGHHHHHHDGCHCGCHDDDDDLDGSPIVF